MLTTAQLQALKADLAVNVNTVLINGQPVAINAVPHGADNAQQIANWYNQDAAGPFLVFNSAVPNASVFNQVLFANYTPSDAITSANAAQWTAASMACQGKQFNLQIMLQPGGTFNAGLLNLRKGLKDAMTVLPTGAGFASQDGGWNASLNSAPCALTRNGSNAEKLFAVATTGPLAAGTAALGTGGAQGTANVALLVFDGSQAPLAGQDVVNAWNS